MPHRPELTGPTPHLELHLTVRGECFNLSGVFPLAEGMAAFDRWVKTLGGNDGVLTPAQVTDLLARAEKMAARLESVDDLTPNP